MLGSVSIKIGQAFSIMLDANQSNTKPRKIELAEDEEIRSFGVNAQEIHTRKLGAFE